MKGCGGQVGETAVKEMQGSAHHNEKCLTLNIKPLDPIYELPTMLIIETGLNHIWQKRQANKRTSKITVLEGFHVVSDGSKSKRVTIQLRRWCILATRVVVAPGVNR